MIVPSISVYEVFKKLLIEFNEDIALTAIAHMQIGTVIDLDQDPAMTAVRISVEEKIAMADSMIWVTAFR